MYTGLYIVVYMKIYFNLFNGLCCSWVLDRPTNIYWVISDLKPTLLGGLFVLWYFEELSISTVLIG